MKSDTAACLSVLMLFCISICRLAQRLCPVTALCWQLVSGTWGVFHLLVELLCSYRHSSVCETCASILRSRLATSQRDRLQREKLLCKGRSAASPGWQHPHKRSRAGLGTITRVKQKPSDFQTNPAEVWGLASTRQSQNQPGTGHTTTQLRRGQGPVIKGSSWANGLGLHKTSYSSFPQPYSFSQKSDPRLHSYPIPVLTLAAKSLGEGRDCGLVGTLRALS